MTRAVFFSLMLHALVAFVVWVDLPGMFRSPKVIENAPIVVDLTQVKLAETTNLPPALAPEKGEDDDKGGEEKPKPEEKPATKVLPPPPPPPPPEPVKPVEDEVKVEEASVTLEEPEKEPEAKVAAKPRPNPGRPKRKPKPPKKKAEPAYNPLQSLLSSVGEIEKTIDKRPKGKGEGEDGGTKTAARAGENKGIAGGTGGLYDRDLTISEKDALASRLRACWNLDPGAKGIEDMQIQLRAHLNADGTVREVDILDKSRYNKDSFYRSVAESARRAVFICAPFSSLTMRHKNKYDLWKTLLLTFDPMDGGVF